MSFVVNQIEGKAGDREGTVFELTDSEGTVRAEVWPMWGFNCLRWQRRMDDGTWGDILYTAPNWETNPVPTRSGHPILFPFPGRMRDGRFTFEGKSYQLPLNDSTKTHAIHGFTPRNPWRVIDDNGDDDFAFVVGEFHLRDDLPTALTQWPNDFKLTVTYRLHTTYLRVTARVENPGPNPVPFGLGYHPYFRLPALGDADLSGYVLQANVEQVWEVDAENLPTGWRPDVPPDIDFRHPRPIGSTTFDNVFTEICGPKSDGDGLVTVAELSHPDTEYRLRVLTEPVFRELVLFTPPHRHAIAIEPYSCSADAANLWSRGITSGWRLLPPGNTWESIVEYHIDRG